MGKASLHLRLRLGLGVGGDGGWWVRCARGRAHLNPGDASQSLQCATSPRDCLYLLMQRVPTCHGGHPQSVLVRFVHDGGHIFVLIVCG